MISMDRTKDLLALPLAGEHALDAPHLPFDATEADDDVVFWRRRLRIHCPIPPFLLTYPQGV